MKTIKTLALAALVALPMSAAQADSIPSDVLSQIRPGADLTALSQTSGFSIRQLQQAAADLGYTTSGGANLLYTTTQAQVAPLVGGGVGGGGLIGGLGLTATGAAIAGGVILTTVVIQNSTNGTN